MTDYRRQSRQRSIVMLGPSPDQEKNKFDIFRWNLLCCQSSKDHLKAFLGGTAFEPGEERWEMVCEAVRSEYQNIFFLQKKRFPQFLF